MTTRGNNKVIYLFKYCPLATKLQPGDAKTQLLFYFKLDITKPRNMTEPRQNTYLQNLC